MRRERIDIHLGCGQVVWSFFKGLALLVFVVGLLIFALLILPFFL